MFLFFLNMTPRKFKVIYAAHVFGLHYISIESVEHYRIMLKSIS